MMQHDAAVRGEASPRAGDTELRFVDIANMLLRHVRALVWIPVLFAGLAGGLSLLSEEYEAVSRFMPRSASTSGGMARLAGLAASMGVNVPVGKEGETVDFYAQLLRSHDLLAKAARTDYVILPQEAGEDTVRGDLISLFEVKGDTETERLLNTVEVLRGRVSSSADMKANLVTVSVTAPWPGLAEQINRRLLDLVSEFNVETRQSQATMERLFIENRMEEARKELADAETALTRYLDTNRGYQSSSHRVLEFERMQRTVTLRQQVYTTLAQSYEQSRIEEVRDMPVVTVLDNPEGVATPKGSLVLNVFLGIVVGFMFAAAYALVMEFGSLAYRSSPESYRELRQRLAKFRIGRA